MGVRISRLQIKRIDAIQNSFAEMDCMAMIVPALGSQSNNVTREVFSFVTTLMYGGNTAVQVGHGNINMRRHDIETGSTLLIVCERILQVTSNA